MIFIRFEVKYYCHGISFQLCHLKLWFLDEWINGLASTHIAVGYKQISLSKFTSELLRTVILSRVAKAMFIGL